MRFQREEAEQVHNAVCIFCETCDGELRVSRREDLAMGFEAPALWVEVSVRAKTAWMSLP